MSIGQIVVDLLARTGSFNTDLDRSAKNAQKRAKEIDKAMNDAGKKIGAGLAVVGLAAGLMAKNAIDSLANLDDMAQKTGAAVEELSKIQQTAVAFSQDMGEVDAAITKLAKGMATIDDESNKTSKALAALGLSSRDASGNMRDPAQLFTDIARKLQDYQDGAQKAALMTDLLGKSGANLLPFMNDLAENVDKFTGVSKEAAAEAARFQDQLGAMRVNISNLSQSIVGDALPSLNALIEKMQVIQRTSITGWLFTSGKEEQNAGARLKEIRGQLESLAKQRADFDKASPLAKMFSADDSKILDAQISTLQKQKSYLEGIQQLQALNLGGTDQNDRKMNPARAVLNYESGTEKQAKKVKETVDEYKKLIDSIQEKIAASNAELAQESKLTEGQRLSIKFANDLITGKMKESDGRKSLVESMLLELTATEKLIAAKEKEQELNKRAAEVMQNIRQYSDDRQRAVGRELSNFGRGDNARELAARLAATEDVFRQHRERLAEDMGALVGSDEYKAKLREIDDALRAQLQFEKQAFDQRLAMQVDWSLGASRAIENYLENLENVAGRTEAGITDVLRSTEQSFAEFLFDPFEGGLKGMVSNFEVALRRMAAEAAAANIMRSLVGTASGGSGGGLLGSLVGAGIGLVSGTGFDFGNATATVVANNFGGDDPLGTLINMRGLAGRAGGGPIPAGMPVMTGETGRELFIPNTAGRILPAEQTARAMGGSSTTVNNTFVLPPEGATKATQNQMAQRAYRAVRLAERRNG